MPSQTAFFSPASHWSTPAEVLTTYQKIIDLQRYVSTSNVRVERYWEPYALTGKICDF